MDVEFRARAVEGAGEDRLPSLPQLGRVVLARRVDDAGQEAAERIAPDEEAKALPVAEMENPRRRAQELVFAGLKELVARIRFEDVAQRLARVAAGRHARTGDDVRRLAAEQRDFGGIRAVCGRRVEAQEAVLATHFAPGIEALDADIVEVTWSMHG